MALGDIDLRFAAGVALGDIDLHFVWKAWRLATSTCILRGRRGTYGTGLALVARLVPVWHRCRCSCLCGRRGPWRHRPSLSVASVALGDIDVHSVGQEEHAAELVTIPNRTEITVKEKELRG